MQVKKKKIIVISIVVVLFLGAIIAMQHMKRRSIYEKPQVTIEGTITEIQENSLSFQDDSGREFEVSLSKDYEGRAGDIVKIWFSGEIAETYPMQITAYKVEKNN